MMFSQFLNTGSVYTFTMPFPPFVMALIVIWSLIWKGVALWKSARNCQKWWFIALLIINTVGILEIVYLAFFQKKCDHCECEHEHGEEKVDKNLN